MTDIVKKTKLTELEDKIPYVSSLATKTGLTVVENKIPNVSGLVKIKSNYNTNFIHKKHKKLLRLKKKLLIMIMTNILILQSLIL